MALEMSLEHVLTEARVLRTFNSLSRDGSSNIEIVTSLVTMRVARDKHNQRCQQKIIYFTRIKEK